LVKTTILAVIALALAGGAGYAQQQWTNTRVPLGGGFYSNQATGPNGDSAHGTTVPSGGGFSSTDWTDSNGHSMHCTTVPLGGGFSSTNCN
jgi:hypothetical protein